MFEDNDTIVQRVIRWADVQRRINAKAERRRIMDRERPMPQLMQRRMMLISNPVDAMMADEILERPAETTEVVKLFKASVVEAKTPLSEAEQEAEGRRQREAEQTVIEQAIVLHSFLRPTEEAGVVEERTGMAIATALAKAASMRAEAACKLAEATAVMEEADRILARAGVDPKEAGFELFDNAKRRTEVGRRGLTTEAGDDSDGKAEVEEEVHTVVETGVTVSELKRRVEAMETDEGASSAAASAVARAEAQGATPVVTDEAVAEAPEGAEGLLQQMSENAAPTVRPRRGKRRVLNPKPKKPPAEPPPRSPKPKGLSKMERKRLHALAKRLEVIEQRTQKYKPAVRFGTLGRLEQRVQWDKKIREMDSRVTGQMSVEEILERPQKFFHRLAEPLTDYEVELLQQLSQRLEKRGEIGGARSGRALAGEACCGTDGEGCGRAAEDSGVHGN